MNWPAVRFEELYLEPSRNGIYKQKQFHGSGVRIVNMGELFAYDKISDQDMNRLAMTEAEMERSGLEDGDLLFGRRSLVEAGAGKCSLVENLAEPTTFESSIIRVRVNKDRIRPRFVYYWLKSHEGRGRIRAIVTGTNVKGIKASVLKGVQVPCPPTMTQDLVVEKLRAYDDLIENNRRRMALLEEAARQLYREWFVRLRFPGHEHTRIIDGVPEGWDRRELEQCVSILETGNRPKGGVSGISDGVPSIGAESIVGVGEFDFGKTKYVPENYFLKLRKGVVEDRDVLVYKDGGRPGHFTPHVSMFGGGFPFDTMALNSHVYRVRGTDGISQEFLYYHLSSEPMLTWMNKAGSGAAIPGIARKDLLRLPVAVPANLLMEAFTEVAATGITQILKLALTTRKLQLARDLLLPRLMSGEIAV